MPCEGQRGQPAAHRRPHPPADRASGGGAQARVPSPSCAYGAWRAALMSAAEIGVPALRELVAELAADPAAWTRLVRHDPAQRVFEQVLDEPDVEAWLICWMPGHDTGFHDHD